VDTSGNIHVADAGGSLVWKVTPSGTTTGLSATVYAAALAPGFASLYQIAIQVPTALTNGDWPVVATIGGVQSPAGMMLTVQN